MSRYIRFGDIYFRTEGILYLGELYLKTLYFVEGKNMIQLIAWHNEIAIL